MIDIRFWSIALALAACATLAACMSAITAAPVNMTKANEPYQRKVLAREAEMRLDSGYPRVLKAGGAWLRVGQIPEGDVYKPDGHVFTVEGADVHEAYLVMSGNELVGFYLPVERGFVPQKYKIKLTFN